MTKQLISRPHSSLRTNATSTSKNQTNLTIQSNIKCLRSAVRIFRMSLGGLCFIQGQVDGAPLGLSGNGIPRLFWINNLTQRSTNVKESSQCAQLFTFGNH